MLLQEMLTTGTVQKLTPLPMTAASHMTPWYHLVITKGCPEYVQPISILHWQLPGYVFFWSTDVSLNQLSLKPAKSVTLAKKSL